jgi:glycosyltransferase involved in cell wall biosynthesis
MVKALGLESHVRFYGWVDDIVSWLSDKQYIVSTSVLESFGYGIAEGMACGVKPLIHNFIGANQLYPAKYCFNSIREFAAMVQDSDYDSGAYRRYIEEHYSLTKQLNEIEKLIETCRSRNREAA